MAMGLKNDPDDNGNARRVLHDVVFVAQQPTNETELAATANDPRSVISSSLPPEQYPFPGDSSLDDTNIDDDASARNFDARLSTTERRTAVQGGTCAPVFRGEDAVGRGEQSVEWVFRCTRIRRTGLGAREERRGGIAPGPIVELRVQSRPDVAYE